ncbi:hypothetical protein NIES4101_89040 [Calothrix sp. NIES-4101]|nr:hypothetical protein NIES4101_89040 [Calothrix sp. NIES-4101]
MTFTQSQNYPVNQAVESFRGLDVDSQLALFWFIYKEMGSSVTPAAPAASTVSPDIAEGLFNQVKDMSHEEQLQIQRDLITGANTQTTRQYGSLSDTTKLLFWYLLAQGMDNGTVIPMPENYQLSGAAEQLLNVIKQMQFEEQITLFRDYVSPMGAEPKSGAGI